MHSCTPSSYPAEQAMRGIKRRELMQAATVGGITLSIAGAATGLFSNEARAQGAPPPAAWPDKRLLQMLKIEHPIIQAPMGFHTSPEMAAAVCKAGGLGSFPCGRLTAAQLRDAVAKIRAQTTRPLN